MLVSKDLWTQNPQPAQPWSKSNAYSKILQTTAPLGSSSHPWKIDLLPFGFLFFGFEMKRRVTFVGGLFRSEPFVKSVDFAGC
jgi:hypothetical protein